MVQCVVKCFAQKTKGRHRESRPTQLRIKKSDHLYAADVESIAIHGPGDGDMMTFVALQDIGIVDGDDLVVSVGDYDCFRALAETFGHAGGVGGVVAFGAAHGIADISVDDGGLVSGRSDRDHQEQS